MSMHIHEEKTISSRILYEGRAFKVRVDTIAKADGSTSPRDIVEHQDCIAVVPMDDDGRVIMVRQFRKAIEKPLLEIPAGGIEAGESPVDCVKRELQEEIGFLPRSIEAIGGFYAAPGYSSEFLHIFLASDLVPGRLQAEDTDGIEVVRVPLAQVPDYIASGKIQDSKSIAALLQFICLGKRKSD